MNDAELLRRYAEEGSQEAFAELVRLRIGLVYAAALRRSGGNAPIAQDVTQAVFTELARKAASLCRHSALVGWLYTTTRFTAVKIARSERRRHAREQEAYTMHEDLASPIPEIPGERLRPLLDDAMDRLAEVDRRALLLRFFDGYSMAELGRYLGLSEPAAKMRVDRALGKLKTLLGKRGLLSTAAAVGAALSQEAAATTVPAGFAASVAGSALVAASATGPAIGLVSLMTASKFSAIIGVASIFGLVSVSVGVLELKKSQRAEAALEAGARRFEAEQQQLQGLLRSAQAADQTLADLQKKANVADRTKALAKAAADLARFKATPEMQGLWAGVSKISLGRRFRLFFEEIGYTPDQIEEVEKKAVDLQVEDLAKLSDDQLRAMLGDQAAQQFRNYARQEMGDTNNFVADFAGETSEAGAPLSADQELQLAQIFDNNSAIDRQGTRLTSVDWAKVETQAQAVLTSSQQNAADALFQFYEYDSALTQAQQSQSVIPAAGAE